MLITCLGHETHEDRLPDMRASFEVPSGHSWHRPMPPNEYSPGAHGTQGVLGLRSLSSKPGKQGWQRPDTPAGVYVPAGQGVHGVPGKKSSSVEPGEHSPQVVTSPLLASLNVPSLQRTQTVPDGL